MAIINESAARLAKQMRSFDDYKEGSATASYNAQCAEAAAILEKVKAKCATDEQRERAEYLYNRYCSILAEAINRDNEIGTRCPSVLICGAGNFPTRKKEKADCSVGQEHGELPKGRPLFGYAQTCPHAGC